MLLTSGLPWAHGVASLDTLSDHSVLMKTCESRGAGQPVWITEEHHQLINKIHCGPQMCHVSWFHMKSESQSHHEAETCIDLLLVMRGCYPLSLINVHGETTNGIWQGFIYNDHIRL